MSNPTQVKSRFDLAKAPQKEVGRNVTTPRRKQRELRTVVRLLLVPESIYSLA